MSNLKLVDEVGKLDLTYTNLKSVTYFLIPLAITKSSNAKKNNAKFIMKLSKSLMLMFVRCRSKRHLATRKHT